jgi:dethiobiotin synthetase
VSSLFVSATGTGCGKTWLARGIARAGFRRGKRVAALKPIECGVAEGESDASLLARACGRPELATAPGLVRLRAPLSPRAAALAGEPEVDVERVAAAVRALATDADLVVVEGAGGVLTPVSRGTTMLDLVVALGMPLVLVAPNALGTLSHTLAALESCRRRGVEVAGIALNAIPHPDASYVHNKLILQEETELPVAALPRVEEGDARHESVIEEVLHGAPWLCPL